MKGLEPEPGANQGFFYVQWQSKTYQGRGGGPRGWNRSPEGVGLLLRVTAASALVGDVAGAQGLGLHF